MAAQEIEPGQDHPLAKSELGIVQYQTCIKWVKKMDECLSKQPVEGKSK